jgi:hypothetical protein
VNTTPDVPFRIEATGRLPHPEGRRRVAGGRLRPALAELREALEVPEPPGLRAVRDAARAAWEAAQQQQEAGDG